MTSAPLPAAVPGYQADIDHLHRQLGQAHAYVGQLGAELQRRAVEANALDDDNQTLRQRVSDLEVEVEKLRKGVVV